MSVRPTASHTRTPLGTGIIVAPAPRPRPPPKRVTPKPGSARERCRQIQSRSPARPAGRERHRQRRHQNLSEAIRRSPKIPAPAVDQTRRHIGLTRHIPHPCTGLKCRRDNRLLLLDAPPATPLGTRQYLDARHRTVSAPVQTPVFALVLTSPISSKIARRSSAEGYDTVDDATFSRRAISLLDTPAVFNRALRADRALRSLCWQRSSPRQRPKERTLSGPTETLPIQATSSRNGGRNHLGSPNEIKSDWVGDIISDSRATSPGIRTMSASIANAAFCAATGLPTRQLMTAASSARRSTPT